MKWPIIANRRQKVVSNVGQLTGDASDRRLGLAAGVPGPGKPTPNMRSVEEFFYRLRCSPLYINMVFGLESMGGNGVLKMSALMVDLCSLV